MRHMLRESRVGVGVGGVLSVAWALRFLFSLSKAASRSLLYRITCITKLTVLLLIFKFI